MEKRLIYRKTPEEVQLEREQWEEQARIAQEERDSPVSQERRNRELLEEQSRTREFTDQNEGRERRTRLNALTRGGYGRLVDALTRVSEGDGEHSGRASEVLDDIQGYFETIDEARADDADTGDAVEAAKNILRQKGDIKQMLSKGIMKNSWEQIVEYAERYIRTEGSRWMRPFRELYRGGKYAVVNVPKNHAGKAAVAAGGAGLLWIAL